MAAAAGWEPLAWSDARSHLTASLPGALTRLSGPLDGLLGGAVISAAILGAGLYLWGWALHGRVAGITAALLVGSVGPLAILARTLSLYPEVTAAMVLASATAALAARHRTPWAFLAAGAGSALALLVDVRGLLWALPCVGLGVLVALSYPAGLRARDRP